MKLFLQIYLIIIIIFLSQNTQPELKKHTVPVYGNTTLGYYYINLYVGTPPQQQSAILTTASVQFALPCSQCKSCGHNHMNDYFNLKKSTTNKILTCASAQPLCRQFCRNAQADPCNFSMSYAQGSFLSGILMQDKIKFQKDSIGQDIQVTFGCTTKQSHFFYTQKANGVIGLSPKYNSRIVETLFDSHSKQTSQDLLFSICLAQYGGEMTFGGLNQDLNMNDQAVKTTYQDDKNFYTLNNVGSIKINNTLIRQNENLGQYGMFIEVGSTYTYFEQQRFKILFNYLKNVCHDNPSQCSKNQKKIQENCFKITPKARQTLKNTIRNIFSPIQIEINGKNIKWTADKYFIYNNTIQQFCLGIFGLDRYLLGSNWMIDKNIQFNLKEKSISIYPIANCRNMQNFIHSSLQQESSEQKELSFLKKSNENSTSDVLLEEIKQMKPSIKIVSENRLMSAQEIKPEDTISTGKMFVLFLCIIFILGILAKRTKNAKPPIVEKVDKIEQQLPSSSQVTQ